MKKTRTLLIAFSLTIATTADAIAQTSATAGPQSATAALAPRVVSAPTGEKPTQAASAEGALEAVLPRDGLRMYLEIRSGGLIELVKSQASIAPFAKLLSSGSVKTTPAELAGLVMANLSAFTNARVGVAGYGSGALLLIEPSNAAEAETLQAAVATLLGRSRKSKPSGAEAEAILLGRVIVIGPRDFTGKLSQMNGAVSLADDQEFARARGRFEADQFFAYIDLGAMTRSFAGPDASQSPAYTMGAMAALNGMPSAVAIGASIAGDAATVRAFMVNGSGQRIGLLPSLFSAMASASQPGQPGASGFVGPDADLFVDVMLDWDKVYGAIQSMLAMFAGSLGNAGNANGGAPPVQSGDILGMLESSLGFSIKHDLIPTLGGELAFSLAGLSDTVTPKQAIAGAAKPGSSRFMLIVALKDPVGFEKLIVRLFNRTTTAAAQFARTPYRGVIVNSTKSMAYAIVNGFFVIGGSSTQVRRAIDAQATGVSLASSEAFKTAFAGSHQAALQAYVAPALTNVLFESLAKRGSSANAVAVTASAAQARLPITIQLIPGADGMVIEARLPANLALMAFASMAGDNAPRTATMGIPVDVGVSEPGPRVSGGSRTPRMTDDDMRRRP